MLWTRAYLFVLRVWRVFLSSVFTSTPQPSVGDSRNSSRSGSNSSIISNDSGGSSGGSSGGGSSGGGSGGNSSSSENTYEKYALLCDNSTDES